MLARPITVAIADDHTLFRKMLKNLLSEQKNIQVLIQAQNAYDLFSQLKTTITPIDVLLLDLFMPQMNGNEALKIIHSDFPDTNILILSMCMDTELITELLDSGIHGYISKSDDPEELLTAIQTVSEGRIYRNHHFTDALYRKTQKSVKTYATDLPTNLNEREKRILEMIWEEKSNKEIADELFLGIRSIEKIRQDIKEKLRAKSTIGVIKYGIRQRIINTGFSTPSFFQ
jgi:DNA-binding NarL/FixJ family response regulator